MDLGVASLIGSGISAVGSLFGNIFNRSSAADINQQNIAFQREENRITREREDTAFQRAARDLEAAGLSKTLAAGSPASAASLSVPHAQQLPKYESVLEKLNLGQRMLDIELAKKKIEEQDATIDNVKANTESVNIANGFAAENHKAELDFKRSQVAVNQSEVSLNYFRSQLVNKESEGYMKKLEAEVNSILANTELTKANKSYVMEKILTEVKSRGLIDEQNKNLVINYLNQELNYKINDWNLKYAQSHLKPVNYNYGTIDAVALGIISSLLKEGLSKGPSNPIGFHL